MDLRDIGEWKLIELIRKKLKLPSTEEVLVDIGDDAACVKLKELTVLTVDSYLEDIHFSLRHYNFYDIGYRTLACSLSDIAAMGAEPKFVLVSLQIPSETNIENVELLYSGMLELANKFNFRIVGGDTVRSKSLGVVCTIVGQTNKVIERRGAKVGDSIFVTGELGSSSFGLYLMQAGVEKPEFTPFIEAHKRPSPRIEEGRILSRSQAVNAMIDISDGLAVDLHHLTEESGVGAVIHYEKLPVRKEFHKLSNECSRSPIDFILYGGEDYELLFTLTCGRKVPEDIATKTGTRITEIGRITEEKSVELEIDGKRTPLPRRGYDHFKKKRGRFYFHDLMK